MVSNDNIGKLIYITLFSLKWPSETLQNLSFFYNSCLLVSEKPDSELNLKGPIYEFGKVGHKYEGDQSYILNYGAGGVDKGQALNGPLYKIDDPAHHFDVIIEQAKAMKELQGPIYCDLQHHYHEISKKIETIQGM